MSGLSRRDFFLTGAPLAASQLGILPRIPVLLLDPESSLNACDLQRRAPLHILNNPLVFPRQTEFRAARGAILATSDPKWISLVPEGTPVYWPFPPKLTSPKLHKLTRRFGLATHYAVTLRYSSTLSYLTEQITTRALNPSSVRGLLPANSGTPLVHRMNAAEIFRARSGPPIFHSAAAKGEMIAQFLFSSGVLEARFPDGCLSFSAPFREPTVGFLRAPNHHSLAGPETTSFRPIVLAANDAAHYDDPAANSVRSWLVAVLSGKLETLFTGDDFIRGSDF